MSEKDVLISMAKRLEAEGKIFNVEYPTESELSQHLEYESGPYAVRFVFDANGAVIESCSVV